MRTTRTFVAAAVALLAASPALAQSKLTLKVYTASPGGFLVNSTLIAGEKDAVLIDGQFARADAHRLAAMIIESGKNLTTVYVTHSHPDHWFGLEVLRQAFPKARFVAQPLSAAKARRSWKAKVDQWKPMYGENLASEPPPPMSQRDTTIMLEGETLYIVGPVQGDDTDNSYVWIPSLRAVVTGDMVFNGVHVWAAETNAAQRRAWTRALDRIAALNPEVVVAGHQKPELGTSPSSVAFTKEYLAAFDSALASSKTPEELVAAVKAKYPDLALDVILNIAAQAALKPAP